MPTIKCYDKFGIEIENLTQWDMNVILKIYDFPYDIAPVFHFAGRFDKTALCVSSTLSDNTVSVRVPNILLTESKPIKAYVFLYDLDEDTGRTIYVIDLPVLPKPKPDDYEYSDNTDIIDLHALKVRLEALIAQAEEAIGVRMDELAQDYQNKITEIKTEIADDVDNLNKQITNANTHLINEIRENNSQLSQDIQTARNSLNTEIENALNTLIAGIRDGSPKGTFSNTEDLVDMPAGIYLYINSESENNGYIYYWDGSELSDRLLYYAGIVVNNGSITYEKLAEDVKKRFYQFIDYVLAADEWVNGKQVVDISEEYTTTTKTKVDVEFGDTAYNQMLKDDCAAIYITTNEENDGELLAHYIGNQPTEDITVQLNIVETY